MATTAPAQAPRRVPLTRAAAVQANLARLKASKAQAAAQLAAEIAAANKALAADPNALVLPVTLKTIRKTPWHLFVAAKSLGKWVAGRTVTIAAYDALIAKAQKISLR